MRARARRRARFSIQRFGGADVGFEVCICAREERDGAEVGESE